MPRSRVKAPTVHETVESVAAEIERIAAMRLGELRAQWRDAFSNEAPSAFSKDLLARAIAYRLQEDAYGGLNAATARLLRSLAKPGAEPPRRVKIGSVIVRAHKGVLHEVMVTPGGFCWRGTTYDTTIARKITGVSWNGPRFFGLRSRRGEAPDAPAVAADAPSRAGRRSSIRTGAGR